MTVESKGDEELARALAGISDGLAHLDDPATEAGRLVAAEAQRRAPRRTGRLRTSITTSRDPKGVLIGTPIKYGIPVHQGVPSHNMAPRPFLAEALRVTTEEILRGYGVGVQKLIDAKVT